MIFRLRTFCLAASLVLAPAAVAAQVPADQLLRPPADARQFVVISSAGEHGRSSLWRAADGMIAMRESILLRGFIFEQDQTVRLGANGMPERVEIRGVSPSGNAAETFEIAAGTARWRSPVDEGSASFDGRRFYQPQGGPFIAIAVLAEQLFRAPGQRLPLLPDGEARLTRLTDAQIGDGATRRTVTAYAIEGLNLAPDPIWLDADGNFFANISFLATIPREYAGAREQLRRAQADALAARAPAIARRFGQVPAEPVAFTHVRLFDADAGRFVEDQTVVAHAGTITAVGDSARTAVPPGARVIEGRGQTLVPGIWDAHMHVGSDEQGLMLLAIGVTSGRDPGGEVDATNRRNQRIRAGELLFPRIYSSVLIDGAGPLQAQGGVSVNSAEEAVAAVRRAHEQGFAGVKFYTSMRPDWLRAGIVEAHRLGLHVHGHVPATMRPSDAVAAGYDEITHINFVMMEAMPQDVVDRANTAMRIEGPARYSRDVDLAAAPMAPLIADLARRRTVIDPTLVVYERGFVSDDRDLSPALAPYLGTMPAATERGFRGGGFRVAEGATRAQYRESFTRLVELTGALHAAGVPIVAGTDGSGLEIIRELELYVRAGMTPARALQTATIGPARLVGAERETGSIAVGKQADLVLVDGDPSRIIGDLRRTVWVMSDGQLMDADALREAAGFRGRPR